MLSTHAARPDALAACAEGTSCVAASAERDVSGAFLLRALGVVRQHEDLISDAVARFDAVGLDWHVVRTRAPLGI